MQVVLVTICALGVVCHDISVRGDRRFCNLGLAVVRWRFGPLLEAFSVDVPHKKDPSGGNLGVDPLLERTSIQSKIVQHCRGRLVPCLT